jgi:hypothetical protein
MNATWGGQQWAQGHAPYCCAEHRHLNVLCSPLVPRVDMRANSLIGIRKLARVRMTLTPGSGVNWDPVGNLQFF